MADLIEVLLLRSDLRDLLNLRHPSFDMWELALGNFFLQEFYHCLDFVEVLNIGDTEFSSAYEVFLGKHLVEAVQDATEKLLRDCFHIFSRRRFLAMNFRSYRHFHDACSADAQNTLEP